MTRDERDALIFHAVFSALCVPVLLMPGPGMGVKLFILVLLYNVALPVVARVRVHAEWLNIWIFAILLSMFQVFPDWILSSLLNVLVFPEDGFPMIGTVSGYMAGLWTIPTFIIVYSAMRVRERFTPAAGYAAAALLSLVIYGVSEQTVWMLPSWYAQNVLMVGHMAVYIIIPEVVLGTACVYAYIATRGRGHLVKLPAAFLVMLLYLGSAVWFYFILELIVR